MADRGVIAYPQRARQLNDFSGLRYGTITPTDVDVLIDLGNRHFVVAEIKGAGVRMPFGQELAFTRLVDCVQDAGKYGLLLEAEHQEPDSERAINVAECLVRRYYVERRWSDVVGGTLTVRRAIDEFLRVRP